MGASDHGGKEPPHLEVYTRRDEETAPDVFEVSGSIKWFDPSKGYGFIVPVDEDLPEVLLHVSCLRHGGFQTAYEGARVVCEVVRSPKGLQAVRIRSMDGLDSDPSIAVAPAHPRCRRPRERLGKSGGEMVQPATRVRLSNPWSPDARYFCAYGDTETLGITELRPDQRVLVRYGRGPEGLIAAELKPDNAPGPSSH